MCGRFALTVPLTAVIEWFGACAAMGQDNALKDLDRPRHNIRPTETIWMIRRAEGQSEGQRESEAGGAGENGGAGGREIAAVRWGFLPVWYKKPNDGPLLINARGETVAEKPAFREACRETRCLIPADGFYEWKASAGPGKAPYWIHPGAGDRVAFAGVWRRWTGPDGAELDTVAIVTCAAEGPLADLHHRLPVRIAEPDFGLWLGEEGGGAARLMRAPDPAFWAFHPVSTAINRGGRAAPDGPELREPTEEGASPEPAGPTQQSLF
ncbi:MAG: SOS response-associated peptidase [Pseudomonadota bacterium]